jgi:hypothetical protein
MTDRSYLNDLNDAAFLTGLRAMVSNNGLFRDDVEFFAALDRWRDSAARGEAAAEADIEVMENKKYLDDITKFSIMPQHGLKRCFLDEEVPAEKSRLDALRQWKRDRDSRRGKSA